MKEDHNFSNCKVGDLVTDALYGYGKIISIDNSPWPINVIFENNRRTSYTLSGRINTEVNPTLYHGHVELTITTSPRINYKKGEWIAVSNDEQDWFVEEFVRKENDSVITSTYSGFKDDWKFHKSLIELNEQLNKF